MNLTGTYTLKVTREQIWAALNDPEVLRQCTPGCKEMRLTGQDSYDILMEVGVGSVKGRYTGKIQIRDRVPGQQYKLAVTGTGSAGFVKAEGVIQLRDEGEETRIEYSGQAHVGGPVAGVGQRVMEGAAKFIVGQFFKCLETTILQSRPEPETGPDSSLAIPS